MSDTRIVAGALLRGEGRVDRHLVVKAGPDTGRSFPLGAAQTLGRGRDADLRLTDPAASRLHARISRSDGRIVLADLRSKNGVRVNGRRCRGARQLAVGDELSIGMSRLTLEPGLLDASEVAAPPPPEGQPGRRPTTTWGLLALLAGAGALISAAALLLALP
jgi:pSer/pThr/pTyr-binding forkhead associated (FHA) protein